MVSPARALVRVVQGLHERGGFDPFAPSSATELRAEAERQGLDRDLRTLEETRPWEQVGLIVAQALEIQRETQHDDDAPELVVTVPGGSIRGARSTRAIVDEMLASAQREVLVVGYEITDEDFVSMLQSLTNSVARIIVCDRERGTANVLRERWPSDAPRPKILQNTESSAIDGPYGKMHGKLLLVDGSDLLATSANFTFHGLHSNVEFGVRVRGASARSTHELLRSLLARPSLFETVWG